MKTIKKINDGWKEVVSLFIALACLVLSPAVLAAGGVAGAQQSLSGVIPTASTTQATPVNDTQAWINSNPSTVSAIIAYDAQSGIVSLVWHIPAGTTLACGDTSGGWLGGVHYADFSIIVANAWAQYNANIQSQNFNWAVAYNAYMTAYYFGNAMLYHTDSAACNRIISLAVSSSVGADSNVVNVNNPNYFERASFCGCIYGNNQNANEKSNAFVIGNHYGYLEGGYGIFGAINSSNVNLLYHYQAASFQSQNIATTSLSADSNISTAAFNSKTIYNNSYGPLFYPFGVDYGGTAINPVKAGFIWTPSYGYGTSFVGFQTYSLKKDLFYVQSQEANLVGNVIKYIAYGSTYTYIAANSGLGVAARGVRVCRGC